MHLGLGIIRVAGTWEYAVKTQKVPLIMKMTVTSAANPLKKRRRSLKRP